MTDTPGRWQGALDRGDLIEANAPAEPLTLFDAWFAAARDSGMIEPTAMTLATVDADGTPSARIVLLKGHDDAGFRFYSNYDSRKGRALAAHPVAALVFWWEILERQVRVTGGVHPLAAGESDAYYARRSRDSQIGAHASQQSRIIADRAQLDTQVAGAEARYATGAVPRPASWGGYRLCPDTIEFWQARRSRLHDRLRYRRDPADPQHRWIIERLSP